MNSATLVWLLPVTVSLFTLLTTVGFFTVFLAFFFSSRLIRAVGLITQILALITSLFAVFLAGTSIFFRFLAFLDKLIKFSLKYLTS